MDDKDALILSDSVVEATRIANMELRESAKGKHDDDEADNQEANPDSKLFGKKRKLNSMHSKGFGARSFAKKR